MLVEIRAYTFFRLKGSSTRDDWVPSMTPRS